MSDGGSNLIGVLVGGAMTAVVGNFLIQKWQRRNWFDQQRQLIRQQEVEELKAVLEAVTRLADARLHSMRALVNALKDPSQAVVEGAVDAYRKQVMDWNSNLRSFYPMITLHCGYSETLSLERDVHGGFVAAGKALELAVRVRRTGAVIPTHIVGQIQAGLNAQGGRLSTFYQTLANSLERHRNELVYGRRHDYKDGSLSHFSTSDLIKALFTSDVDGFNVVRPA